MAGFNRGQRVMIQTLIGDMQGIQKVIGADLLREPVSGIGGSAGIKGFVYVAAVVFIVSHMGYLIILE